MAYVSRALITTGEVRSAHDKRISICLHSNGFSFAVTTTGGEVLVFGEAEGEHAQSMTGAIGDIKSFFATAGIKPLGYAGVELIAVSDEHTFVPDELFEAASARQYLKLVGGSASSVLYAPCKPLASTAVFAANEQLATAFKVAFPGLSVVDQHLKLVQLAPRSKDHPLLASHWRQGRVDLAVFQGGKYVFGNTLPFAADGDALFRVLEVMKAFKAESSSTELLMCGEVTRDRFSLFRPYFPSVSLFSGFAKPSAHPEMRRLHTYKYALILM